MTSFSVTLLLLRHRKTSSKCRHNFFAIWAFPNQNSWLRQCEDWWYSAIPWSSQPDKKL